MTQLTLYEIMHMSFMDHVPSDHYSAHFDFHYREKLSYLT